MKTHSKYRMFSIPRSDLCFLHTFGEVAPSQCTTSFPKHCCVDLLACLCNKEVSLLTWIDIHLYFYTLVGLIVCLISGDRDNHFSLSPAGYKTNSELSVSQGRKSPKSCQTFQERRNRKPSGAQLYRKHHRWVNQWFRQGGRVVRCHLPGEPKWCRHLCPTSVTTILTQATVVFCLSQEVLLLSPHVLYSLVSIQNPEKSMKL